MVVWIPGRVDDLRAESPQRALKGRGTTDAGERQDPPLTQRGERLLVALGYPPEPYGPVHGLHDRRAGVQDIEAALQFRNPVGLIGARQAEQLCACQRVHRLPQQAAGEKVSASERIGRVHRHDVEGPGQPEVLETVVQQDDVGGESVQRPMARFVPVPADYDGDPRQEFGHQGRLIADRSPIPLDLPTV